MKVKCEYCGNFIPDTEEVCPVCGAPNEHMVRSGDGIPKTIEELKAFALSKNLPLDLRFISRGRFFVLHLVFHFIFIYNIVYHMRYVFLFFCKYFIRVASPPRK